MKAAGQALTRYTWNGSGSGSTELWCPLCLESVRDLPISRHSAAMEPGVIPRALLQCTLAQLLVDGTELHLPSAEVRQLETPAHSPCT